MQGVRRCRCHACSSTFSLWLTLEFAYTDMQALISLSAACKAPTLGVMYGTPDWQGLSELVAFVSYKWTAAPVHHIVPHRNLCVCSSTTLHLTELRVAGSF